MSIIWVKVNRKQQQKKAPNSKCTCENGVIPEVGLFKIILKLLFIDIYSYSV